MAKSRETSNKKDKEKKKELKRKNKEQKKMERAANPKKSTSFEDMIAYVDENGQLTSTPPDPSKKKVINEEDIILGIPRKTAEDEVDPIRKGSVTFFNTEKGYGFIKDQASQESVFVHVNNLLSPVKENDKVSFEVENGPKGPNAVRVKLIVV